MSPKSERRLGSPLLAALAIGVVIQNYLDGHSLGVALTAPAAAWWTLACFRSNRRTRPSLGKLFRDYVIGVVLLGSYYLIAYHLWGPNDVGIHEIATVLVVALVAGIFTVIYAITRLGQTQQPGQL